MLLHFTEITGKPIYINSDNVMLVRPRQMEMAGGEQTVSEVTMTTGSMVIVLRDDAEEVTGACNRGTRTSNGGGSEF